MEKTAMFNGYYTDKKVQLAASNYNFPLAYFLVTVTVMLFSLIVMVRRYDTTHSTSNYAFVVVDGYLKYAMMF